MTVTSTELLKAISKTFGPNVAEQASSAAATATRYTATHDRHLVCDRCAAHVSDTDSATALHSEWHAKLTIGIHAGLVASAKMLEILIDISQPAVDDDTDEQPPAPPPPPPPEPRRRG